MKTKTVEKLINDLTNIDKSPLCYVCDYIQSIKIEVDVWTEKS